ncbi:MAG: hypothetical protein COW75_05530 [Rhodobacterales bacterium CG18_big_fil_WC_8_21_14_2_50_71_9]|nr:MAG: hypothetical protein COW75_05530 [Rhodobacterales bacterium CG18_big_fil_WC_8_21_14_2_50_71_9]PJA60252.1 MAG: hypothetical protein CO163_04840 [Rhodobacterales bacterium CG_4_9_14_3_um_filter_71_31]
MQRAVEQRPDLLQSDAAPIRWLSPLRDDAFAEYRDEAFLERLGLGEHAPLLRAFWPARGPQWDALGWSAEGPVLVEAKAHIGEFLTPPTKAGAESLRRIAESLAAVQADLGAAPGCDWTARFYQYANRLAHLWWLHRIGVGGQLLFVSFLGDDDMGGPDEAATWQAAFRVADYALGLPARHALSRHIRHVTPHVGLID